MRILFLSQRFLLPMDTGGKIRTGKILEQLSREHDIVIVGNYDPEIDGPRLGEMKRFCRRYVPVAWKEPRRGSVAFYWRLAKNLLSKYPVTALNDYSPQLERALLDTLAEEPFDLAICDFVQSALMFKSVSGIPTLLFQHNVEAKIALRHLDAATNVFTRTLWAGQHRRMFAFEAESVRAFDKVIAVSDNDAGIFAAEYGATNAVSIPTGVDVDFYEPGSSAAIKPNRIVFCGSMDWLPNEDGIKYFLAEIAPALSAMDANWELVVVGRNPSEAMKADAAKVGNVELTGWVDDVRPYLREAAVCIVPLRIGGGTRMKIYEAMAMGKAVISTTVGAEGLEVTDNENIRLVDDPAQFAAATSELLQDPVRRDAIGEAARALVVEHFGWSTVATRFGEICRETAQSRPQ